MIFFRNLGGIYFEHILF